MARFESKLYIDGHHVPASTGETFQRISPISGDLVTNASAASPIDAQQAANKAAAAFPAWSETGPGFRRELLLNAAKKLDEIRDEFIAAMAAEIGATRSWAEFNIKLAGDILRDAASLTTQISGSVIPTERPATMAMGIRQPVGVCLGLAPWNAPIILGFRALCVPLACGNTVVLKASELCPYTHSLIGKVFDEAGFPHGCVNVLTNAPSDADQVVEELIAHPAIRRINFTGSTRVGRMIAQTAAKHLKKCLLELGGKAPLVILDDANIEAAVDAATFGSFLNQGQICMATERIVVMDEFADDFVASFSKRSRTLKAGDPENGVSTLGPLIGEGAASRLNALLEDAESKGAKIVVGGKSSGVFMDATIVDYVTPAMKIYNEECFGPIATIIRVSSVNEAVTVANDSEYGLSAAVFGRDITRAMAVGKRIESGICHINSSTVADEPQMPFGGMKYSGYGRFGGLAVIDEFTELRWMTISDGSNAYHL